MNSEEPLQNYMFDMLPEGIKTGAFEFSYNESTHKPTLTLGSEKEVWEIIKLTQKAVFFKIIDEDGYSEEITEFRVLD